MVFFKKFPMEMVFCIIEEQMCFTCCDEGRVPGGSFKELDKRELISRKSV